MNSPSNQLIDVLSRLVFLHKFLAVGVTEPKVLRAMYSSIETQIAVSQLAGLIPALDAVQKEPNPFTGEFDDPPSKIATYLCEAYKEMLLLGTDRDDKSHLYFLGKVKNGIQMSENFIKPFGFELIKAQTVFFGQKIRGFRVNGRSFFEGDLT